MHELEKNAEPSEIVLSHFRTIIDGKVLVRKLKTAGFIYEEFTLKSLRLCQVAAPRQEWMLFVICIAEISIKKAERVRRKYGNLQFKKIVGSRLIKQLNSFLSSAYNKTELIKFIVAEWEKNARLFSNKLIYIICEQ